MEPKVIYKKACLNCNGDIDSDRLDIGICRKCIKNEKFINYVRNKKGFERVKLIYLYLKKHKKLKDYKKYYFIEKETYLFKKFFKKLLNNDPWSAQISWFKRVIKNESFSIVAPTGVGKTTFGMVLSLYLINRKFKKKILFILPTTTLVDQVFDKFTKFNEKLNNKIRIIRYSSSIPNKDKKEIKENIKNGNFDILIITHQFLSRDFNDLKNNKFDFIFIDDVDAMLKSSKNIDKVLLLIGFDEEDIKLGEKIIYLKQKLDKKTEKIIKRLKNKLEKKKRKCGNIILSSATGRAKGRKVKLFRELLDFEIGGKGEGLRNIIDTYILKKDYNTLLELIRKLGIKGGLIFVSKDLGIEEVEKIEKFLNENNIKAKSLHSKEKETNILNDFAEGKIDVLIGVAHFYGLLTRGLDLPDVIRYAIFYEVPRFKINATKAINNVYFLLTISNIILKQVKDKELELLHKEIKQKISNLSIGKILLLNKELEEKTNEEDELIQKIRKLQDKISKIIKEKYEEISKYPYASFEKYGEDIFIYIPDVATYIQASGRTSRLYALGVTKGISIILTENEKLLKGLERKLRWRYFGFELKKFDEIDLDKILKEIDEDRKKVKLFKEGKIKEIKFKEPIKTVLFVVESPNKARTIANFFGKPARRRYEDIIVYETSIGNYLVLVMATVGHLFDLIEDEAYYGVIVNEKKKEFIPIYGTIKKSKDEQFVSEKLARDEIEMDKKKTIDILRLIANEADLILVATDFDEEGEKIAFDIRNMLRFLDKEIKRAEFHEVTIPAILNAIYNPKDFNINWVKAQIVRRIEDRWIGFALSRKLWEVFNRYWYSAGRVQTPVLGWVIDRYDKRINDLHLFLKIKTESGLEFYIDFEEIKNLDEGIKFSEILKNSYVDIEIIDVYEKEINPLPPYDTERLILDANLILHYSAQKTMNIAQNLFELAFITYHRTDSIRVSNQGIEVAKEYIKTELGKENLFYPRKWGEGGAHECIRPTMPIDTEDLEEIIEERGLKDIIKEDHIALYDLILRRFISSQMKPAKVKLAKLKISLMNREIILEGVIDVIEESFLSIYKPLYLQFLPFKGVKKGYKFKEKIVDVEYKLDSKYKLFTQGTLIAEMRKRGIGRPSTYATIVRKLLNRNYIEETKEGLIPTKYGREVYNYLTENYYKFVSEERTKELEKKKELIMEGKLNYIDVLYELYQEIKEVENA